VAPAVRLTDVAVARGRATAPVDRPHPGRLACAPAGACEHLGPVVRGPPPVPLAQPSLCRAPPERAVQADDRHAVAPQGCAQSDLLGVGAGQPSGRLDLQTGTAPSRRRLAPALHSRTDQGRAPGARVTQLPRRWDAQPSRRDARAHGSALAGTGVRFGVWRRGYSSGQSGVARAHHGIRLPQHKVR
jgi:hypothetical protein